MSEIRISSNAIAYDSSILLYESSKETTNLDPKFYKIITGSGNKSRFGTFGGGTFSGFPQDPGTGGGGGGTGGGGGVSTVAPNLSDITVTKNQVVYDSAGKPTVTVSFKIKNSSGVAINGVNTRVSML